MRSRPDPELTERERAVLRASAAGWSAQDIARYAGLTPARIYQLLRKAKAKEAALAQRRQRRLEREGRRHVRTAQQHIAYAYWWLLRYDELERLVRSVRQEVWKDDCTACSGCPPRGLKGKE